MSREIFVHVPYRKLREVKEKFLALGLSAELYFSALDLENCSLQEIKEELTPMVEAGLSFTIHAPFMDLNPGSVDPAIRKITLQRWLQLLPLVEYLQAKVVVVHPGFDHWRYGALVEEWTELALQTLLDIIDRYPPHLLVAVENIFDKNPWIIKTLLDRVNHPRVGHCFDVGHFLLFSKTDLDTWFQALGPHLLELHLHDNQGDRDAHMGIGRGIAPWDKIFSLVESTGRKPIMVIEAHSEEDALVSLEFLKKRLHPRD
ncbi:MAG: sugar phosphate isomerase/epimerase [Aquificota bacterium]|nr:MAG: sugar phosphate isomerase/epimerase [Aquificota bacterium]